MNWRTDVLIVTATKVESKALVKVIEDFSGNASEPVPIGDRMYHNLGIINSAKVFLVQSEKGAGGLGASLQTVQKGIDALSPAAVIMTGIAFGTDVEKQSIGDILVSQRLMLYDLQRVGTENGKCKLIPRGERIHATPWLFDRFQSADLYWDESKPKVHFGLILSGDKLVDNIDFREQLREFEPEAIGGEMEGAGLYAACQDAKVDWILVKSICDWADGHKAQNKEAQQRLAAYNSACFVLHVLLHAPLKREERQREPETSALSDSKANAARVTTLLKKKEICEFALDDWQSTPQRSFQLSSPPDQIEAPPLDFIGRDDEVSELLNSLDMGVIRICLLGMGGIGKTTLATHMAGILGKRFPDGQLMVNMQGTSENPLTPSKAMGKILHAYNEKERLPKNEEDLLSKYITVMKRKKALLLLDNASGSDQVISLIKPASCGVIVTSRRKFTLPGAVVKDLDILKKDKAVQFLLNIWMRKPAQSTDYIEWKTWEEIARLCGYLPLALRAAGTFLANTRDKSPEKYAEELRYECTRLEQIGSEGVELSVRASFNLSYKQLSKDTANIFRVLSIFPSDFDADAEEVICEDLGHEQLSELVRWNLVEYQQKMERYHLHDLVRIFAASRLNEEMSESELTFIQQRFAEYYKDILYNSDMLFAHGKEKSHDGLSLFDREWANIQAGQIWSEKNAIGNDKISYLCSNYPLVGVHILSLKLHAEERIHWSKAGLIAARRRKNRHSECFHLGIIGWASISLGQTQEAIEYFNQAQAIAQETGDLQAEGHNLAGFGKAYATLGYMEKAIHYMEQALTIAREDGNPRAELLSLNSLGRAYININEILRAIKYFEQALAIARETGDARNEGSVLAGLGRACADLGDTQKAIGYYEQALTKAREIRDLKGEALDFQGLGRAYADLGETQKAMQYFEQVLAIARETGHRRSERASLSSLGRACADIGDMQKAKQYFEQALAITREIGDRQAERACRASLGRVSMNLGEMQKIQTFEQALAIAQANDSCKEEADALAGLGRVFANLGEAQKAKQYFEQALAIARDTEDRQAERANLAGLGRTCADLGDTQKAKQCFEQALAIAREIEDRQAERASLADLGRAYADLGEAQKAILYAKQALAISQETGDWQGEAADLAILSSAHFHQDEIRTAVEYSKHALEISQEKGNISGEANYLAHLGRGYSRLGEKQKALRQFERALAISRKTGNRQGEAANLAGLGRTYIDLGEMQKAIQYFKQALTIARKVRNRQGEAANLAGIGRAYADLGETQKAIQHFGKALIISKEEENRKDEGTNLSSLGRVYIDLGETQKAIQYFEQALTIARNFRNQSGEAASLFGLGRAYIDLGETQKAIQYFEQAQIIAKKAGNRQGEAANLVGMGLAYIDLGETQKAIQYFEQALAISRKVGNQQGESTNLACLGRVYADLGETQMAIQYFEQALAIAKKIGSLASESANLAGLGRAYADLGETQRAIQYFEQALALAKKIGNRHIEGVTLFDKSLALDKLSQRTEALECAKESLKLLEEIKSLHAEKVRQKLMEWETYLLKSGQ